jgi:exopolyphosphatase/guanosine-5'-triphosphate,3'-diphosphate pyrophosphatase
MAEELLHRRLPTSPEAMSTESAQAAAWSFGTSDGHGRRVHQLALDLFERLKRIHGLGEEERLALGVAALLHDSGTIVAYPDHALHSSYLVQHHPLYGLDHRGLLLAALSVATHEGAEVPGKIIKAYRWVLEDADGDRVRRMGAMLALAEALAEGRPTATFGRHGGALTIHLGARGALSPRSLEKAARTFRRVFGMEVRLRGG